MSLSIMIVDDEENARVNISDFLKSKGYEVIGAASLEQARSHLKKNDADIILLDVRLPDGYGPDLLFETAQMAIRPPIIIITAFGEIEMAVDAMKNGAHDFLTKPVEFNRLEQSLVRASEVVKMRREIMHIREAQQKIEFVIGEGNLMRDVVAQAQKAGAASLSVLITGESGTGKEILANFIHQSGPRSRQQFIAVNSAAIQNTMLESELFGFEAGAFTGAEKKKIGLMEVADGGILFLDEISSMPMDIQAKLLRAIDEKAFRRVGGTTLIHVDVQLLTASNRDLKKMIQAGQFREDLYYRLKVIDLHLPSLRDRKEDIPELVGFFIRRNNSKLGVNIEGISPAALSALKKYNWPGNIRELSNVMERAAIFCATGTIETGDLPSDILHPTK
jgi:two-component system response regulator AtoC